MDTYAQYARSRRTRPIGLSNRRLAAMLGDFVYESASAEDESRRYLEMLNDLGEQVLTGNDLKTLRTFTGEHNRDQRRAEGIEEKHVPWGRIDELSQEIIHSLSQTACRSEPEFEENTSALDRMFATSRALREFRNQVAHRTPIDGGGSLSFYRRNDPVTPRDIWGWTEVAASYWSNLTSITTAISVVTGVATITPIGMRASHPLEWPPPAVSIHALRVIERSGISVPEQRLRDAQTEWTVLARRWRLRGR